MVKFCWGITQSGIGITWGGNRLFGIEVSIHLLLLTISIQLTKGQYGI